MRIVFLFVPLLLITACSSRSDADTADTAANSVVNDYPALQFVLPAGDTVATRGLTGKNIFIFFQPDCVHCHVEARAIHDRLDAFSGYTLWFVSSREMEEITAFAEEHDLYDKDNIRFAWSSTNGVLDAYGPIRTPSAFIYDDGALKKSFSGPTPVDSLINAL